MAPIIFVYRDQTESNVPGVNKSSACYHNVTATRTKQDMAFDVIIFAWVPRSWGKLWTGWILETALPCFHTAKKLYISLIVLFYFWSYYSNKDNTLEKRLFCCLFSVIIISVFQFQGRAAWQWCVISLVRLAGEFHIRSGFTSCLPCIGGIVPFV